MIWPVPASVRVLVRTVTLVFVNSREIEGNRGEPAIQEEGCGRIERFCFGTPPKLLNSAVCPGGRMEPRNYL
jgi:hypothetical protein